MRTTTRAEYTAADRAEFDQWAAAQLSIIREHYGITDVFDWGKCQRAGRTFADDLDIYRGSWKTVRPWLTEVVRHLFEAGTLPRWTVTQWVAARAAGRDAEERAEAERADDPATYLSDLAYIREQYARRGELIAEARRCGAPWKAICEAMGLSRPQANKIWTEWTRSQEAAF